MNLFVGITSYARPHVFELCLLSLVRAQIAKGVIAVIDSRDTREREYYMKAASKAQEHGLEVIIDISDQRRGFVNARNKMLDLAGQLLNEHDILVMYDDDYICPGVHAVYPALTWFKDASIGLVGGRVVDLRRRRADPDFYLNILPGVADRLSEFTGFVFLDTKHGPRYTYFTLPLRALRIKIVKQGVRFDPKFCGTGYRSEDDFNLQVANLGYKIVFEPRFWAIHLCLEYGGCRTEELPNRFYWKARNHAYYVMKHKLGVSKLVAGMSIILAYAALHGVRALKSAMNGFREGLLLYTQREESG